MGKQLAPDLPGDPIFVLDETTYIVGMWFMPAPSEVGGDVIMLLSRRPADSPMTLVARTRLYSPGSFAPDGSLAKDPFTDGDRKRVSTAMIPADEPEDVAIAKIDGTLAAMIANGMGIASKLWRRTPRRLCDDTFMRDLMSAPFCHWKLADHE